MIWRLDGGGGNNNKHHHSTTQKENDFFLFERRQTCLENEAVGRRVLFDGTNEILVQKLDPVKFNPLPWIGGRDRPQPQEKPSGQQLIQQVWDELQDVPCVASEDVCDTLSTPSFTRIYATLKRSGLIWMVKSVKLAWTLNA
jgi:hypothetical protein